MRDIFSEIWASLRRNKLRTCLTGFAVSWGIFIVIFLLGAGNGLINSFEKNREGIATNVMDVYGNWTSKPYAGMKEGRRINLDNRDVDLTAGEIFAEHIDKVVASVSTRTRLVYGKNGINGLLTGNYPERQEMDHLDILHGRFVNDNDIALKRKVIVLPENVANELLDILTEEEEALSGQVGRRKVSVESIIGKYVKRVDMVSFTFHGLPTEAANEAFEKEYRAVLNSHHNVAPNDSRAIRIDNQFTSNMQMGKMQKALHYAFWFIGILTLLGGIVGVGNIMLITVKERTREFGIRKAIGARPWAITRLILAESVAITAAFGYIGMLLGMIGCQILDKTVGQSVMEVANQKIAILVNPLVGMGEAIEVTVVLIVAGTLAGLFPAHRAAKVTPIEALRAE